MSNSQENFLSSYSQTEVKPETKTEEQSLLTSFGTLTEGAFLGLMERYAEYLRRYNDPFVKKTDGKKT